MANNVTLSALYLGTFADLDTNEGDSDMESESSLIGTYGSAGAPLYKDRTDVVTNSASDGFGSDDDDTVNFDHDDNNTPDTISYDIGGGPVVTQLDSGATVNGVVTFTDGTTQSSTFAVVQDQNGALFLLINDSQNWLDNKPVESFQITSVQNSNYSGVDQYNYDGHSFVACFTDDALIMTPTGLTPIADLKAGDMVMTRDHGAQPIRWIGETKVTRKELFAQPNLQPYRIKAGCFGPGMPFKDLTLSPQHRVLTGGKLVKKMFGDAEMLIAVKHLERVKKVQKPAIKRGLTYRHILFDRHEVIFANGLPSESLLIGQVARNRLPKALLDEIETLMPQIAKSPAAQPPARVLARGHHGRLLSERLQRRRANGRSHDGAVIAAG